MKHDKDVQKAVDKKFGKLSRPLPDERKAKGTYEQSLRTGANGDPIESPLANPDILSDENVLLPESAEAREAQRGIHDAKMFAIEHANLTAQQKAVLAMIEAGLTQEEIGEQLHISRVAVTNLVARARKKIVKLYQATRYISPNE